MRELLRDEIRGNDVAKPGGRTDHLVDQRAHLSLPLRRSQQPVSRDAAGRDGEAIVRDIPDQLSPARFRQIIDGLAFDPGALEERGQLPHTLAGWTHKLAQGQIPRRVDANIAWGLPDGRNERQPTDDTPPAEERRQQFVRAEPVLQGQNRCLGSEQGREQRSEPVVCGGLERDDGEVDRADFPGGIVDGRSRRRERLNGAAVPQRDSPGAHFRQAAAPKEMHLGAGQRQSRTVIGTDSAGANNGDPGICRKCWDRGAHEQRNSVAAGRFGFKPKRTAGRRTHR